MRRLVCLLIAGSACSSTPARPCPTVDELTSKLGGDEEAPGEYELLVSRCVEDGWSASVKSCLERASKDDDVDSCLRNLSPSQLEKLDEAGDAWMAKLDVDAKKRLMDHFAHDLMAAGGEALFASVPACQDWLVAIDDTLSAALVCKDVLPLDLYAATRRTLAHVRDWTQLTNPEQAATLCEQSARALRSDDRLRCVASR